jgi:hypothetical protein
MIPFTSESSLVDVSFRIFFENWRRYGLVSPSFLVLNHTRTISTKRLIKKLNNRLQNDRKIERVPEEEITPLETLIKEKLYPEQKNYPELQ